MPPKSHSEALFRSESIFPRCDKPNHIFSRLRGPFLGHYAPKERGDASGQTPLRCLGLTDTGAFPDRHDVQVKDRLAWLAGEIRQSEIPPIRVSARWPHGRRVAVAGRKASELSTP
jgi:hypothetical protein